MTELTLSGPNRERQKEAAHSYEDDIYHIDKNYALTHAADTSGTVDHTLMRHVARGNEFEEFEKTLGIRRICLFHPYRNLNSVLRGLNSNM